MELNYIEKDGLLYPDVDTGSKELQQLDQYGKMRLEYIHVQKPALYRALLFTNKLVEHCQRIETEAFKLSEQIQEDDFWMRVSIRMTAQMAADEVVRFQVIEASQV